MQIISCRHEYRALLPIARTESVFHAALQTHSQLEGIFDCWRDRYAVAGTSNATRSKRRRSLPAQRLRGAAGLLAEWLRICLRMGYVGNLTRRNPHQPERKRGAPAATPVCASTSATTRSSSPSDQPQRTCR